MLAKLLESNRSTTRPVGVTLLSLLAHAMLATLVVGTITRDPSPGVDPGTPSAAPSEVLRWVRVAPGPDGEDAPTRDRATARRTRTPSARVGAAAAPAPPPPAAVTPVVPNLALPEIPAIDIPDVDVPGPDYAGLASRDDDFTSTRRGRGLLDPLVRVVARPPGEPYLDREVERRVAPMPDNPRPEYPPSLIRANVAGEVIVQFVVDSTGALDQKSIRILRATHVLFIGAVRKVLPRLHFFPAEVGGTKVSVLVEQPFIFTLR